MHQIAGKAVAFREALKPEFKVYAQAVVDNAKTLASWLMKAGYGIVSSGTDSHVMLVDFRGTDMTGAEAESILEEVGITCNKNTVPGDPHPPMVTSGIRLGTAALTSRGSIWRLWKKLLLVFTKLSPIETLKMLNLP